VGFCDFLSLCCNLPLLLVGDAGNPPDRGGIDKNIRKNISPKLNFEVRNL
jgi:hypothetical protein